MLRKLLLSLTFSALSFPLIAQDQSFNELSVSEIQAMTWVEAMQDYRVNFHTVVEKFEAAFDGKPYEKGQGWKQFKRWEYMMGQRVGEDGVRPHPGVLYQAIQSQNTTTEYGNWSSIGPFDAPSGGGIGRINNVAFHPIHNDTIYAGAPAGGLWVSYDDGQTWQTFTDELTNIGVSDLAIDPLHPDTMYLATGDRDAADTYSFGLMKSTDGGFTWSATGLSFNVNNNYRIGRVIVHPDSTNIVVAATNGGIYRSTNYGQNFTLEQSGLFYGVHMGHGDTLFATTSGSNPRVYRSLDAGDSWTQLTSGLPTTGVYRCEVAVSTVPGLIYAVFGSSNYGFGGLYRSTNGGSSWSLMSSTPNIMGWSASGSGSGGQAWYDLSIACDPLNENTIYVGGVNIWKSTNGGSNWSIVGHWYGAGSIPYVHADHHHAAFRPGTSQLYVGTDGGVYKTANGGSSWTHLNDGMNITQYYKISQSTSDTNVVLAGAQDNGSHLKGLGSWSEVTGGDGMDNGVDVNNDNVMYTSIYYGDFYKSTNGGSFFSSINTLSPAGSGNWVTPFKCDPVNSNTVYAGFTRIWKSTNGGSFWSATSSSNISGSSNIDEFEISKANTNYIYVLINGNIFKSTNGGSSWSNITPSGSLSPSSNNITGVDIDEDDENHIVISISGYTSNKKVMESFNGGSTWSNLSSGLPNVPVNCVAFENQIGNGIYVGTDIGVYYLSSAFNSWVSFNKDLPNVIVIDFEVYEADDLIRIGTYGRGVWQSKLFASSLGAPVASFEVDPNSVCNISDTIHLVDKSSGAFNSWKWNISPNGYTYVKNTNDSSQFPAVVFNVPGNYSVELEVTNNYGTSDTTIYQAINVGGYSLPFTEDFEMGSSRWSIENPDQSLTWDVTNVGGTLPGNKAAFIAHFSYNSIGEKDALITPALDFSNDTMIELSFEYSAAYYSSLYADSLKIYISDDCGDTWNLLASFADSIDGFATIDTGMNSYFIPQDSTEWCHGNSTIVCPNINLDTYSGSSSIKVKFESVNGFGNNLFIDNINIIGIPSVAPVASFYGDTAGCEGTTLSFYDNSSPTPNTRTWLFPGGSPATSSSATPVVTYNNSGTYDVALIVQNAAGIDTLIYSNYVSIVQSPLAQVSLNTASINLCNGDSAFATATWTNGGAAPSLNWVLNGTVVASNTTSYANTFQNGDVLTVRLTSSDDCVANPIVADSVTFTVNSLPQVSLGSQGYVCELDGPQALSGGQPAGGIYSGAGVVNDSIYPSTAGVGSHWIYYTYTDASTGCSNTKQRAISVQPAPSQPTVTQNPTSGELEAGTPAGTFTYQWLDANMDPIAGATNATYLPAANGTYYVRIFSNILCSNVSDAYSVVNIGLDEELLSAIQIYPNPAQTKVQIALQGEAQVRIVDAAGREVYNNWVAQRTSIDVQDWARGAYIVQTIQGTESVHIPLILQ